MTAGAAGGGDPCPLTVLSVFAPSPRNGLWYDLQRHFIRQTTEVPYRYRVILNGVDPAGFEAADVAFSNRENLGHSEALVQALEYLRRNRCATYLLLDSDAFPVIAGWHGLLTERMARFHKRVAAPVRVENLDVFPHPCAFFILDSVLDDPRLDFRRTTPVQNLLGVEVLDAGGSLVAMRNEMFPLIRTNVVNLHPVAAAIYYHMFYHHGAGSRAFDFRATTRFGYYEHLLPNGHREATAQRLLHDLERDPDRFVRRLMGQSDEVAPFAFEPTSSPGER